MISAAERLFRAMNTDIHVIVVGGTEADLSWAETQIHSCERKWSRFLPDSEISAINRLAGRPVVVSPDTFQLVADTIDAYQQTDGVFDPTVLTSLVAAGYDRSWEQIDVDTIAGGTIAAPGVSGIELLPHANTVRIPRGVGIDVGGIAKGAVAERVATGLCSHRGAQGACISIGGDLQVSGVGPDGDGWPITIDCVGSSQQKDIYLVDGAVCTSTTLKRRWQTTQGSQHHLRNPATGRPLESGIVTLSVVGASAKQAEVLTKVGMAAGPAGAEAAVVERGATGLMVLEDGSVETFEGFSAFLHDGLTSEDLSSPAELIRPSHY